MEQPVMVKQPKSQLAVAPNMVLGNWTNWKSDNALHTVVVVPPGNETKSG